MKNVELRKVKKGEFFTFEQVSEPREKQIWIKNHYDRTSKKFSVSNYADVNRERFVKPNIKVWID